MSLSKAPTFSTQLQEIAAIAKALAHPARLAILDFLAKEKNCISGEIVNQLPLSRSTVSQHLKELQKVGFIKSKSEGVTVCYCIDNERLELAKSYLNTFLSNAKQDLNCNC